MKTTAEDKLLALGLQKFKTVGVRGLKLRRLCAEAGVSPGTFTTHFKTMRQYTDRLLALWYEPLCEAMQKQRALPEKDALARLRGILQETARFFQRNAGEVFQFIMDISAGEPSALNLAHVARFHHILWLKEAIAEAQEAGQIVTAPVEQVLFYLFGGVNFATLAYHVFSPEALPGGRELCGVMAQLADDEAIMQRLEWTLSGIILPPHGRKGDPA